MVAQGQTSSRDADYADHSDQAVLYCFNCSSDMLLCSISRHGVREEAFMNQTILPPSSFLPTFFGHVR
jgi:hypothetical protein